VGKRASEKTESPSKLIDARIRELADWRGEMLARVRQLIRTAEPDVVEAWKWRGVPVWYHDGMICTGETYKDHVKLTFAQGASIEDPTGLFNASLEGSTRRAIDLREGDEIDEKAFQALVRAAAALNASGSRDRPVGRRTGAAREPPVVRRRTGGVAPALRATAGAGSRREGRRPGRSP
jgi:hypothetical protein